jgi:PTH1 family peptidyl-tRNA hydrolase
MVLFVGLGNPGERYAANRHNIGFLAVEAIARRHKASAWRRRFSGETTEASVGNDRALILKPMTFMNESGRSVGEAVRFFKLALDEVIVLHDELDLIPGKVRVKTGGGVAGHNGLRSITDHIGNDYRRVRIGIGHPGVKEIVHQYVLSDFAKAERPWVESLCDIVADNAALLAKGDDAGFQNRVHLAMNAKGFGKPQPSDESAA